MTNATDADVADLKVMYAAWAVEALRTAIVAANDQGLCEVADPGAYALAATEAGHSASTFAESVGLRSYRLRCAGPNCADLGRDQIGWTPATRVDFYDAGNAEIARRAHDWGHHAEEIRDCLGTPSWVEVVGG